MARGGFYGLGLDDRGAGRRTTYGMGQKSPSVTCGTEGESRPRPKYSDGKSQPAYKGRAQPDGAYEKAHQAGKGGVQ